MRGARFWRPDATTKLMKCSEFISDACDPIPTDTCCAVIPCSYCVTWAVYGETDQKAVADFLVDGWYATIAGVEFRGYWERNYDTEECEFVVTLDDLEVYRNDCYGGVTCRDSSDSAEATIGYDDGTLTWTKIEPRPLEYVTDYDTNCKTHFCGSCECSCDCLCVTVTDSYGDTLATGEICDTAYPCDGPVWEGTVGDYVVSLALGEDSYGECAITPTVDGVALAAVSANGCGTMSAVIELADGNTITVACKVCDCSITEPVPCVCLVEETSIWCGYLTSGTECASPIAARLTSAVVPTTNLAWNTGDCVHVQQMRHLKNPFIGCMDPDNAKRVAWIQKRTDTDTPNIDNSIVQKWDWYIVVYANATDTILSIHYEYSMCCINANMRDDIDTFLAWVRVFDVTLGPGIYDMVLYNPVIAAEHGNCGFDEPTCVFPT